MPIYRYECERGHRFEEWHKMRDRNNVSCPECGSSCSILMVPFSFSITPQFQVLTHDGRVLESKPGKRIAPKISPNDNLVQV